MGKKSKTKIKISDSLFKDLKKYAQSIAKSMAISTREELSKETKNAIDFFYNDYDPEYYKRTYNLRDNTFAPYYSNAHGDIYRGGVTLSNSNWKNKYHGPDEYVFNLTLGEGLHGLPWQAAKGEEIPRTVPTPIDRIEDARDNIISNINLYKDEAISFAKRQSYDVIQF